MRRTLPVCQAPQSHQDGVVNRRAEDGCLSSLARGVQRQVVEVGLGACSRCRGVGGEVVGVHPHSAVLCKGDSGEQLRHVRDIRQVVETRRCEGGAR